jgi:hypothetical protein
MPVIHLLYTAILFKRHEITRKVYIRNTKCTLPNLFKITGLFDFAEENLDEPHSIAMLCIRLAISLRKDGIDIDNFGKYHSVRSSASAGAENWQEEE